jgi:ribulose-5-phosphate 4-epimerase/fuculose-1-phosphate aldolase
MNEIEELKRDLVTAAKILLWEVGDMWGHVSSKTPDGKRFLLLPLRPPVDSAIPDDNVLEYDLDGNLLAGKRDQPEEIFFYTSTYKAKKDIGSVIHVHPPVATSVVATGKKIIPMRHNGLKFGKGVPITPWLYGTWQEDGDRAAKAMGSNCAVMIRGHGANLTGRSLQEACINTIELERTAKMIVWASAVGKIKTPFSSAVLKKYQALEAGRVKRRGHAPSRSAAWAFYESMVQRGERWTQW